MGPLILHSYPMMIPAGVPGSITSLSALWNVAGKLIKLMLLLEFSQEAITFSNNNIDTHRAKSRYYATIAMIFRWTEQNTHMKEIF